MQRALIGSLRFLASRRRRERLEPSTIKVILLVELTRLGDIIAMLPALVQLQMFFQNASIRVLVDQRYISLLSAFDTNVEFTGVDVPETATGLTSALRFVRRLPVDLAISMSPPRKNALVTLASSSRFKLGYLSYLDSLTPFLNSTPVDAFGFLPSANTVYARESIYTRPLKILMALGIESGPGMQRLRIKRDAYDSVHTRLSSREIIPERRFVLLHPFSGWEFRNWSLAKYIALAERIVGELGFDVMFSCEEKDHEKVSRIAQGRSHIKITASSDLLEVAVLMLRASLVVCGDSGPLHLAAAMNVRSVGLFGPASPELTAPMSDRGHFLYKRVECSPCDQRTCVRPGNPCMGLHEVTEVFSSVASVLDMVSNEPVANNA